MKIGLFLEDQGHDALLSELVRRVAEAEDIRLDLESRNAIGGAGRAVSSYRSYVRDLGRGKEGHFDVLIVAIDANCRGVNEKVIPIRKAAEDAGYAGRVVPAVPDPHVEAWYLSDGVTVAAVAGAGASQSALPSAKCDRGFYKRALADVFRSAGIVSPFGGAEFGLEIAHDLDLERGCASEPSLGRFIGDLRATLRELKSTDLE